MNPYFILALILTLIGSHGGVYVAGRIHGAESIQNKALKAEIKEVRNEAKSFADRPRNRTDRVKRLCAWADDAAKAEGKPIKRLPAFCGTGSP